jgi:hypothetical protein
MGRTSPETAPDTGADSTTHERTGNAEVLDGCVPIRDLAARAGVLAGVWPPEGVVRTVVVELDQRRWCIYPDPESDDGWVAALTDDDGRPEPDTEVWLPRLAGESKPVTYWRRLLDATDWLPERWMGRRPPRL